MYKEKWRNYFFEARPVNIPEKWTLLRAVAKNSLSSKAQEKLEWLIFYHTIAKKNAVYTAAYFGINPKTLHKWLKRFEERNLKSLEEHSRKPLKTRSWMVTREEEADIIDLRKDNLEFGKKKLQVIYKREYGKTISTWKIERVIRKYNLYPDLAKHDCQVERRRNSKAKIRINTIKDRLKQIKEFGFLWHIDAIIIWWYGKRRIIFTAMEEITKIAFARVYKTNTSGFSEDFLKRLMYLTDGKINIMHQDNGSEFQGAFKRACETLGILQIYSRPYTPKDNPALENFNGTIQREWLALSKVGLDDIEEANKDLTTWLIKYNSYRPHETLDYKTPLGYAQENFFKVLPMWSARTNI
ncbi:MAG: integrase core domain-containing protein [Candidatus Levybacteria bacterium]|nr:integrase core domain-containing protein [Candidatus Levybacteria bacterium]